MNGAGTLWNGVELTTTLNPAEVATRLDAAVPGAVQSAGDRFLVLDAERLVPAVRFLHDSPEFDLVFLANLTAVDWETHFDLIYQLHIDGAPVPNCPGQPNIWGCGAGILVEA